MGQSLKDLDAAHVTGAQGRRLCRDNQGNYAMKTAIAIIIILAALAAVQTRAHFGLDAHSHAELSHTHPGGDSAHIH